MLATDEDSSTGRVKDILSYMSQRSQRRLSSFSREWQAVPQTMVEIKPTKPASTAPSGMVMIPGGDYSFQVHGIEIEGGNDPGVDVQYPWENSARRYRTHPIHVLGFYMDRTLVTNAEFAKFLSATSYRPKESR